MLIDCDKCSGRGAACSGCMMGALFAAPPQVVQRDGPDHGFHLTGAEQRAIEMFEAAGFDLEVLAQTTAAPRRSSRRPRSRRNVA